MSESTKYMTVALGGSAQAAVAARRSAHDEVRRVAQAEARRDRMIQLRRRLCHRLALLADRLDALTDDAAPTAADPTQDLRKRSADAADRCCRADDQAALTLLACDVAALEGEAGRLAKSVADVLALDSSKEALIAVRDALNAAPYRTVFDPEGTREVNRHVSDALAAVAHDADFTDVFSTLTERVATHLETVAASRAAIEEVCIIADEARADLERVLAQARAEGIALAGADAARELARRIEVVRDRPWPGRELLQTLCLEVDTLAEADRALADELEEQLVRTARTELVAQAVTAELPRAGFKVVAGSTVPDGDRITLRAVRMDDSSILDLEIAPAADGTVAIACRSERGDSMSGLDLLRAELEKHDIAVTAAEPQSPPRSKKTGKTGKNANPPRP